LGVLNARESLTTHSSASVSGVSPLGVPISGTMRGYSAGNNAFDFPGSFGIVPWTVPSVLPWNGSASFNDSSQFGQ
ncbi:MAG: hypothetical protein L3K08_04355, partial [Thermoplasmata archaeon]|nr:hypothetical protein [Thermoplasmata archaeon]